MPTGLPQGVSDGDVRPWMVKPEAGAQAQTPWVRQERARLVLAVEDEGLRQVMSHTFGAVGLEVHAVGTGREALVALSAATTQILIAGASLPDLDGIAVWEQAVAHDPKIAGLLFVAEGDVARAVQAMKAGVSEVLSVTTPPYEVVEAVQRLLASQGACPDHRVVKFGDTRGLRIDAFYLDPIGARPKTKPVAGTPQANESTLSPDYLRGVAEGERRLAEQAAQFRKREAVVADMAKKLAETMAALPARLEAETVTLAFDIARKVIHERASETQELVAAQVREALTRIKDAKMLRILVNPSEEAALHELREQCAALLDGPAVIRIEADPSIAPGGCRIETPMHLVDATVDGQLARIAERLRQGAMSHAR
ncbi:MAG: FliH/SctL family protein [Nitrospiraceae bacterium]